MHKKPMMACMAIAAFAAFVIAPAASASPVLTHEEKAVPVHSAGLSCMADTKGCIIATNVGETIFTGTGGTEVKCDHVKLTGTVTKNSGVKIEGEMTTADFNGTGVNTDCTSNLFNAPVKVTVPKLCLTVSALPADQVVTTGCGANVTVTLNFTGVVTCKYERASLWAAFGTGFTSFTMSGGEELFKGEGGAFCPGGVFLDMTLDFWTDEIAHLAMNPLVIS